MEYTQLGRTGWQVSKLGLGGAPLGGDFGETTDREVEDVVHAAIDLGINFFDTAPLYGQGESERRLGLALRGRRDRVILATKAVMRGESYSYDNTIRSVEESLRRLQTDWIDLIQLHELESCGEEMARNETLPAFRTLLEQGKVRALGVNAGQLGLLLPFVQENLVDTVQTFGKYTLIDHTAAEILFPHTRVHGTGVIHGSPLAMGMLADSPAPFLHKYPAKLQEAERRKAELAFLRQPGPGGLIQSAMRFCLGCPDISVTLTGTTDIRELTRNASYCDGKGLDPEIEGRVLSTFKGEAML
ncbi:aldo/keto reductase [Paenibacillus nasutitermitis]|uniref:Oxidoreductase n=1 Tax=Paenibacillus nasutitermitis TaxID=1652958 RepID=A0A916YMY7_9BACL|nr:aldo/keto reductase [Paenibacillus nasutitermitis]GGD53501.1 oxidoreductase [Paenibacillus nasutitermitis]